MKKQEVFDAVAKHLIRQNRPAQVEGSCKYRTPSGLKCAAGCLITDCEYKPEMEGLGVESLCVSGDLPERLKPHVKLLSVLQRVHDMFSPGADFKVDRGIMAYPDYGFDTQNPISYTLKEALAQVADVENLNKDVLE